MSFAGAYLRGKNLSARQVEEIYRLRHEEDWALQTIADWLELPLLEVATVYHQVARARA